MNADGDGTDQTRLTNLGNDNRPVWSPDGTRIAFTSNREDNIDIYVVDVDGQNLRQITDGPESEFAPSWSPDGTRIAYIAGTDDVNDLYIVDADGGNTLRVTTDLRVYGHSDEPLWSPDGSQILIISQIEVQSSCRTPDCNFDIYLVSTDGSTVTRLTDTPGNDEFPQWSPDGQWIVFDSYRDGNYEVYLMDSTGAQLKRLTENDADDTHANWMGMP
jgi:TolB protein